MRARRSRGSPLAIAALLAPAVLGVGGLFVAGLAIGLFRSLRSAPLAATTDWTFANFSRLGAVPGIGDAALLSLTVATASTGLAVVLGVSLALVLDLGLRRRRWGRALLTLVEGVLAVPHVVAAVGLWLLVAQSGILARIGHRAGLVAMPSDFPILTHDPGGIGIVLTYAWKEIPFVAVVTLALLQGIDRDFTVVARSLGATSFQAFRHVTLPRIGPGVLAAAAMVFAFALGAYEVPAVMGGSNPRTLPVIAVDLYTSGNIADRPAAVALSLLLATASFALIWGWRRLSRFAHPGEEGR